MSNQSSHSDHTTHHTPHISVRKPFKAKGRWYLEQLVRNTNGSFSVTNVLVSKIKSGKFIERTFNDDLLVS